MIVESPEKAKHIREMLGPDEWTVEATVGHIQYMASAGVLGFDRDTLEIEYVLDSNGKKLLAKLRNQIKHFDRIIVATDLDREGEAIAKHVIQLFKLGNDYERVTFNEITKEAVFDAINNKSRKLNTDLVAAQESRRIIDRIVGWEHTSALTSYLGELTPVGRVQTQFVKLIVDKEREIENFKPTPHWSVTAFLGDGDEGSWRSELDIKKSGVAEVVYGGSSCWINKEAAESLQKNLKSLEVISSEKTEVKSGAPMPFETSTLQGSALTQLGLSSKESDKIAQQLYMQGHITYIRTDSTELSNEAFRMITDYAKDNGLPVLPEKRVGKKGAVSQEAHECIRPTDFSFTGDELSGKERDMYKMIWIRAVASQLEPAVSMKTTTVLKGEVDGHEYIFNASGSVPVSPGWRVLLEEDYAEDEDIDKKNNEKAEATNPVPILDVGDVLDVKKTTLNTKTTKPPAYFDEKSLNSLCKNVGIARPSTYSSIIEKILEHKYVVRKTAEKGSKKPPQLRPTEKAFKIIDAIGDSFKIMDLNFTKKMEDELDAIANGNMQHKEFCKEFFEIIDAEVLSMAEKPGANKDNPCEDCGGAMIRMKSRDSNNYWWLCPKNACRHKVMDLNGRPASREEVEKIKEERKEKARKALEPFLNEDGTPKFPCPNNGCGRPLRRIASKNKPGSYFWGCTAPRDAACNYIAYDDAENEVPVHDRDEFFRQKRELEKQKYSNEDGEPLYPCPKCGSHVLPREGSNGIFWACCKGKEECGFTAPNGEGDKPDLDREARKAEKLKELSNPDGTPKWPCGNCGGHLIKRESKDKQSFWFGCMSFPRCKASYQADSSGNPDFTVKKAKSGSGKKRTKTAKPRPKKGY